MFMLYFFFLMRRRPPDPPRPDPPFPITTLFRSRPEAAAPEGRPGAVSTQGREGACTRRCRGSAKEISRARSSSGQDHRDCAAGQQASRSEEHTSELQSLMRISYAVFCLKKKKTKRI